jgi:hypothetical protein
VGEAMGEVGSGWWVVGWVSDDLHPLPLSNGYLLINHMLMATHYFVCRPLTTLYADHSLLCM